VSAATLTVSLIAAVLTTGPTASGAQLSAVQQASQSAADGSCTKTKLSGTKAIRTRSGKKLGTAQMFVATQAKDLGFCVRISPTQPLRKITTQALLPHKTYYPDGERSSNGLIGGSGLWRYPLLVTGSDFGTGYSMKATAKIVVPGGPSGKAKISGTLP
jgi:uncharacterized low-complexity protein